jgi:hypothetical protein
MGFDPRQRRADELFKPPKCVIEPPPNCDWVEFDEPGPEIARTLAYIALVVTIFALAALALIVGITKATGH